MCGILGFSSKQPVLFREHMDAVHKLMELSGIRGKEASGIMALNEKYQALCIKSDLLSNEMLKSDEYKDFLYHCLQNKVYTVLGHSRLATNGSQLDDENNQPVISDDSSLIMIHNGIIANATEIWSKISNDNNVPILDTKVMTEYISSKKRIVGLKDAFCLFMNEMEGSASIALLEPNTDTLILSTNTGSLYYIFDDIKELIYFASEKIFLIEILNLIHKKKEDIIKIIPKTGIVFKNGEIHPFNIEALTCVAGKSMHESNNQLNVQFNIFSLRNDYSKSRRLYGYTNNIEKLRNHKIDFDRIANQRRCSKCILPASTPFITFDDFGICNFCNEHQKITYRGKDELEKIIDKYRSKNGEPDCLAAFSGGRDSSYGLHYLKKELGLNPIAYTYDWGMVTDLARRNQARMLGKLGIEHLLLSADITKKRLHIQKNIKAWLKDPHLGMVPLFMQGDKQCEFYADQMMKKYNLKLMFFFRGNELEKEEFKNGHCGIKDADPGGVIHHLPFKDKLKLLSYYGWRYIKNPSYFNASFWDTGLAYFSTYIQQHDYLYLWHYIPWNEDEINKTLINEYNWEVSSETIQKWRTDDGSSAFYNYIYCQVQGFTENDSFRSRQIREGVLDRESALKIVLQENQPRYESLKWYFDQVGLDGVEVLGIVDKIPKLY